MTSTTKRTFKPGQTLFNEGDEAFFAYIIRDGQVQLTSSRIIVGKAGPGDMVGEVGLFNRSRHTASAKAVTDVSAEEITYEELTEKMARNPDLSVTLLNRMAGYAKAAHARTAPMPNYEIPPEAVKTPAARKPAPASKRAMANLSVLFSQKQPMLDPEKSAFAVSLAVLPFDNDNQEIYRGWVVNVFENLPKIIVHKQPDTGNDNYDVFIKGEVDNMAQKIKITAFARGNPSSAASIYIPKIEGDIFYTLLRAFALSIIIPSNTEKERILLSIVPKAAAEAAQAAETNGGHLNEAETGQNLMVFAKALAVSAAYCHDPKFLEQSISAYTKAMNMAPVLQKDIYLPLGLVYQALGEKRSNPKLLERAITAFDSARTYMPKSMRNQAYASLQYRIGQVYMKLGLIEGMKEDFDDAAKHFKEALQYYTKTVSPMGWAEVMVALGTTFQLYCEVTKTGESLTEAANYIKQALTVYTREKTPLQFAHAVTVLGNIIIAIAKHRQSPAILDQAQRAYTDALQVYRRQNKAKQAASITANMKILGQTRAILEKQEL
ncbi:MAG: cyclic nucleotide-binding domain-containing protein [Alphaproteobacteria bacterium]|nr:cyclic nucleotide-binding domain-containing protein [Alphaproteobacteria bacterium]